MSNWKAKRFWKAAAVTEAEAGFGVALDGRAVKTPGKALLVLPSRALAAAIAAEWDAQQGQIDPRTMPLTRTANSAIDKVTPQRAEVAALIADYGGTDHLCYRAATPAALRAQQDAAWQPLLAWAATRYGAPLRVAEGVVPIDQPPDALARLTAVVASMDPFELAALHDLVAVTGSLILGLAVAEGHLNAASAWVCARIDEDWQILHWGDDDEAQAHAAAKRAALLTAERFWQLAHLCD
ncbi:MAG: ATPase [Rhodobacteraceae bacterium]|nr:ATPase [Paracoccaceae bacterium]